MDAEPLELVGASLSFLDLVFAELVLALSHAMNFHILADMFYLPWSRLFYLFVSPLPFDLLDARLEFTATPNVCTDISLDDPCTLTPISIEIKGSPLLRMNCYVMRPLRCVYKYVL